jgi:hypothetical protein
MKRWWLVAVLAMVCTCASTPKSTDELDIAIRDTSDYLNDNIPKGNKIVILNIRSDYAALSEYIIDELIANAVNDKVFAVVDRAQLEQIRMELNFQLSGEVSDQSALEIGKFLGAQTIVTGTIGELADRHRMRIRALNVETAEVQGQYNRNINTSRTITALMKGGKPQSANYGTRTANSSQGSTTAERTAQAPTQSTTPAARAYKVGDTGPAGGLIFYDKGRNTGGWRYLEAAPEEAEFRAVWSVHRTSVENTEKTIGNGRRNTQLIVEKFKNTSGEWDTAAQKANDLVYKGFDDWFLPSQAELDQMYGNLKRKNLGDFKDEWYWSSTHNQMAHSQQFSDGRMADNDKVHRFYVRPIRQVAGQ